MYTEFTKKKVFGQLTLADVSFFPPVLHVTPYLEIFISRLPWWWRLAEQAKVKNFLYSKLCAHKQCSQCSCSCVEILVILQAKFHVVLSLLTVLRILMLSLICPEQSHWKWVWPENENTVNLKSASFIVIMLLHEGLTRTHSQKKAYVAFWREFHFKAGSCFQLRQTQLETSWWAKWSI